MNDKVNSIIEQLNESKEDFVVDWSLDDVYTVWVSKSSANHKPRYFKDYDKAYKYAVSYLKKALKSKTIAPASAKEVTISKGNTVIDKLTINSLTEEVIEEHISEAINYDNFKVPSRDVQKMKEYYAKGSNPTTLARTVKDVGKAVARYYISIATGWNTCSQAFYDRCVSLGVDKDDLDKIYNQAIKDKSIDIGRTQSGVSNTGKQEDKPKQTVKSTQTPKPVEKPRKVVKAKVDNDDEFPFF